MDRVSKSRSFSFVACVAFCGAAGASVPGIAAPPRVAFDLTPLVACRDVTPPEFHEANPDEKLVEATFPISALIQAGKEDDLLQFVYRVESRKQAVRVFDYSPKTTLADQTAGNVSIEKRKEKSGHLGMAWSGTFDWPLAASGSGDLGSKSSDGVRYELPPQTVAIAASGTLDRGCGVYFKLRPSRSTSLEGARKFVVVFRVPRAWRGDCVGVVCRATGVRRGVIRPLDDSVLCGAGRFHVALYLQGDASAKAAAERLVRAEADLVKTVSACRRDIEKSVYPTLAHKIGAMLEVVEPALPRDWTDRLIYGPELGRIGEVADRLPPAVREAVVQYSVARHDLFALGPTPQ